MTEPEPIPPATTPPDQIAAREQTAREKAALRDLMAPVRSRLRLGMGLQLVACAATVAPYVALTQIGRSALSSPVDSAGIWFGVMVMLGGLGIYGVFNLTALMVCHLADADLMAINARKMVRTLSRVPLGWFSRRSSGRIRKALEDDLHEMHYLVAHQQVETLASALTPLFGVAYIAIFLDWRLALLALATLPIYALAMAYMMRGSMAGQQQMAHGMARVSAAITELVDGVTVLKAFGQTGRAHRAYTSAARDYGEFFSGWVRPMLRLDSVSSIALLAPVVLVVNLGGGALMVSAGRLGPIEVLTSAIIAMTIPPAILTVTSGLYARKAAAAAALRIAAVINTEQLPATESVSDDDLRGSSPGASVVFEGVHFGYDPGSPVIFDLDLHLEPGSVTALVGPSGSGKSTVASLLLRFHDIDAGRLTIDGHSVREFSPEQLYARVGFVLQDVQLLGISLLENIRLGRPTASTDEVLAAARAAQIDQVIAALPRGFDSVVGVDAELSGGERQRVQIARAILGDPAVLVLDEATSFADPESEAAIQTALAPLLVGRTLLIIAHRLETVVGADSIVVLDGGRIAARGSHGQLLSTNPLYQRLWQAGRPIDAPAGGPR